MDDLSGRVAVVTGGASGVGRAMAARFAQEGMRVVLADVEAGPLADTAAHLAADGVEVIGVRTDVTDFDSVVALRDQAYERFGGVHVLCNNAGVGGGAEGRLWDHQLNDWGWALAVNVWGIIHGIKAFVPAMIDSGEPGHVINTSSGNGGVSPMPSTPIYALTKSGVVTITECLYGQLQSVGAPIGVSVLFPGPHMLRTGLFTSWRNRPPEYENPIPRRTPPSSFEAMEARMAAAGMALELTPVEEVADRVVDAIRADQFWILPESESGDAKIRARSQSMLDRSNPTYLRDVTQPAPDPPRN
jgi:NAD(P)-dependent dehydrogenase (short-subunit alcohol dehydrogenase family)